MKKYMTLLMAVVVSLSCCWFIGQKIHQGKPKADVQSSSNEEIIQQSEIQETRELETIHEKDALADIVDFDGANETSDNPWNVTAGMIDVENEGECIFLTPNTSAKIELTNQDKEVSFQYQIHPWMKETSSGAGIVIWVLDHQDTILCTEELEINAKNGWTEYKLDLEDYSDASNIKILCNNGDDDNDSGDWVIIKW